ncbi:nucleoid-associated protein [Moellerella wisconsensis]|uniref:nucleoid-associated protein n=1 Tax=Moellerella wisconsensis TaxID=158849 RepID=UPI001F4D3819|nr:nucleoid-associated protein [Moellerella wisconsensis]UNH27377.1 nucleoid-associated protein [Moellerella wisconsensis]
MKNIIYHVLHKEQQGEGTLDLNPTPFVPNQAHLNFLDALKKAYTSRAGKGFGTFDIDEDSYPMPRLLRDYLSNGDFYDLSLRMMNILLNKINGQTLATGGKVFITDYEDQGHDYMLIAILSEKVAFTAQNWQMAENETLDIEHLKFAGRIDLTAWEADESRYISFLKGQGDIAGYFRDFLACNDALFANAETKKLVDSLTEFAAEKNLDLEAKSAFFEQAQFYLRQISDNNEPFILETFANRVWPEEPQTLKDKLGNANDGISDGFVPDKRSIRALSTYTGKTKHWRLSFDREAISSGHISAENDKIIINNPTEELLKAFE